MQVEKIIVDREKARELYRAYKTHQHYSAPIDLEIQRTYKAIAQGRVCIRALESIKVAGLNDKGLPKLAICRADSKECFFQRSEAGSAIFSMSTDWRSGRRTRERVTMPVGSFPAGKAIGQWEAAKSTLPLIPIHLRPKRALSNYHILWEAEWTPIPPRDPYLLRRIGGDIWLVVAAWDLTEVERAAMATRISA